jgi:hypothetical protein
MLPQLSLGLSLALLSSAAGAAIQIMPVVEQLCSDGAGYSASACMSEGASYNGIKLGAVISVDAADIGRPGAVGITAYFSNEAYMLTAAGWTKYTATPEPYQIYTALPAVINIPSFYVGAKCAYQNAKIYVGYGALSDADAQKIDTYHAQRNPKISRDHMVGLYTYLNGEKNQKYGLIYDNNSDCSYSGG